jgi:hypothetical protein
MSPSTVFAAGKKEFATELKFLLDLATAGRVRTWAREHLVPDPNAGGGDIYDVASLYFDTEQLDVFHRRRRMHRSKYRVRRYGGGPVFLERKLKARGLLAKHRVTVTPAELARLDAAAGTDEGWAGGWFRHKLRALHLRPLCQISYRRTARVQMTPNGPIRLTLDEGLRARRADGLAFYDGPGGVALQEGHIVLELKFRRELPALFRALVADFQLTPRPFSKYRAACPALGLATAETSPQTVSSPTPAAHAFHA